MQLTVPPFRDRGTGIGAYIKQTCIHTDANTHSLQSLSIELQPCRGPIQSSPAVVALIQVTYRGSQKWGDLFLFRLEYRMDLVAHSSWLTKQVGWENTRIIQTPYCDMCCVGPAGAAQPLSINKGRWQVGQENLRRRSRGRAVTLTSHNFPHQYSNLDLLFSQAQSSFMPMDKTKPPVSGHPPVRTDYR